MKRTARASAAAGAAGRQDRGVPGLAAASLGAVVVLFVLSGATGLIYEVIWTRSLTLVFGKTVHAASAVLTAFMGGLALGSALGGRLIDRSRVSPLKIYALLEAGIGLWALLIPVAMTGVGWVYVSLSGPFTTLPVTMSLLRFVLATLALLPATLLMGATLPALSRWAVQNEAQVGSRLGLLYALNTLGGVLGCLAAGFLLLEALGLRGTTWTAAAGNLLVASIAYLLSRPAGAGEPVAAAPAGPARQERTAGRLTLVVAAIALGGFGALALEVVWFRVLLLVFGSTTYSFSAMLAVFLTGIGLGSLIVTPFADRLRRPWLALGLIQAGIGLWVLYTVHRIDTLPEIYLRLMSWMGLNWGNELKAKFLISAGMMLIPTLLSGAVWPVAVRLARPRGETLGFEIGRLYAANTIGAIVGSLAAAFLLLPMAGMQYSLMLVALLFPALGAVLVLAESLPLARRATAAIVIVGASALLALTAAPWDRKMLTSGTFFMPGTYLDEKGGLVLREKLKETRLVFYGEGVTTTPSVAILSDINKAFFNDGKIEGATALDGMRIQRLLGHLPMLLARTEAKTALNIGLGSGITVGAMGTHPVARLDCAEIEPIVLGAARQFDKETFSILERPGLRMIFNDGRNHLMLGGEPYDAISSAPFAPLVGGAASLYTLEHFRLVKSRLAPGGLTAQFLPLYQLSPTDYLSIMRTFAEVFPEATVWFTGLETILVAGDAPQRFDFGTLAARIADPKVAASLREIGLDDPMRLLATYCFRVSDVAADLEGIPLNTDDRPRIEFSAPRNHLVNTVKQNLAWLATRRRTPKPFIDMPSAWASGDPRHAQMDQRLTTLLAAQNLTIEGRLKVLQGELEQGITLLEKAVSYDTADIYARDLAARNLVKLAEQLYAQGRENEAVAAYERSLRWDPNHFVTLYNLARFAWDRGDTARARSLTRQALLLAPHSPSLNYRMGLVLFDEGNLTEAEIYLRNAIDLDPAYPEPLIGLGDLHRSRGEHALATHMYRQAIALGEPSAVAHSALAQSLADEGKTDEAAREVGAALSLSPGYPEAIYTRARLAQAAGKADQARADIELAVRTGGEQYRQRALADPALSPLVK